MKKTFFQIAQDYSGGQPLAGSDLRRVLHWFGEGSPYFPTKEEQEQALNALIWLFHHTPSGGGTRELCSFAEAFSLSRKRAKLLLDGFLSRLDTPVIIGIEGLDGSGKTVQANLLSESLRRAGKRVCTVDFPQYGGFFGREIGLLLSGNGASSAMELDEKSMCLWFALDRWRTIGGLDLGEYDYVIFNRYTLSNAVYQTARKFQRFDRVFAGWIFQLEHTQLRLPVPDVYIYLNSKAELSGENVLKKGERSYTEGLDVYEKSQALLECCHGIYQELARELPDIQVLDCLDGTGQLRAAEEICGDITGILRERGL